MSIFGGRPAVLGSVLGVLFGQFSGAITFDFTTGALPPGATLTRASGATYFDASGTLVEVGNDAARFDCDPVTLALRGLLVEPARTNYFSNPRADGVVAGSPGTAPTNWIVVGNNFGLVREILTPSAEQGIPGLYMRLTGTNTTSNGAIFMQDSNQIAVTPGQSWAFSAYPRVISGDVTAGLSTWLYRGVHRQGAAILTQGQQLLTRPTNALARTQRWSVVQTIVADADNIFPQMLSLRVMDGTNNCDIFLGGGQIEQGAFPTSLILPPSGSPAIATRAEDQLTLSVANGTYDIEIEGALGTYSASVTVSGGSWTFAWPAAAVALGERHLRRISL